MARTPLTLRPDGADRLAAIILLLEATPAPDLILIPLGVRSGGTARAAVIARLPDGGRETLTPAEARLLADCLDFDPPYAQASGHAQDLRRAAQNAEEQAGSISLTRDEGRRPVTGWRRLFPLTQGAGR